MRRTTGAILIDTRPERISRSAWRGEARNASPPKRATSTRAPTIDIISIAQQARPNVAGNIAFARAQLPARSSVVVRMLSSTCFSSSGPSRSPLSIWRAVSWRERKSAMSPDPSRWRVTSIRALLSATRR